MEGGMRGMRMAVARPDVPSRVLYEGNVQEVA